MEHLHKVEQSHRLTLLELKDKAKSLKLISERVLRYDAVLNEKLILNNVYDGLKKHFNFTDDLDANYLMLKNQGYIMGDEIITTFKQGRFDTLEHADKLQDRERFVTADYQDNRIDLLHAFHELDRVLHLPLSKVESNVNFLLVWR